MFVFIFVSLANAGAAVHIKPLREASRRDADIPRSFGLHENVDAGKLRRIARENQHPFGVQVPSTGVDEAAISDLGKKEFG